MTFARVLLFAVSSIVISIAHAETQEASSRETAPAAIAPPKLGGLFQYWLVNDSTGTNVNNRIRRAEIKLAGTIAENAKYFVMIDPAKTMRTGPVAQTNDNKILQDLGLNFSLSPDFEITFGQFKTPSTPEGLDSSSELLFPERSYLARNFGDRREPGAMITYTKGSITARIMQSNGQGTNVDDTTVRNEKDLHFRLDGKLSDEAEVGAFTSAGDSETQTKARYGLNARGKFSDFLVRLDGVRANDASVWTTAGVLDLAYEFDESWQVALRYDALDGARNGADTYTATAGTIGINYFLAKHNSKLQLSYTHLDNMQGGSASTVSAPGTYAPAFDVKGSTAILAAQAAF